MGGGGTVGERRPGLATVGGGGHYAAEGHVGGEGHHAEIALYAEERRVLLAEILGQLVYGKADAVREIVVVAVAGSALQHAAHVFLALEVAGKGVQKFLHCELPVLEDQLLHCGEGVDGSAVAKAFEEAKIQAALVVMVLMQVNAFLHGKHVQGVGQRRCKVLSPCLDDVVLLHEGVAHEVVLLGCVGIPELFPGLEGEHIACLDSEQLVAKFLHAAIVENKLHSCAEVHLGVAARVGVHPGHADFRAA